MKQQKILLVIGLLILLLNGCENITWDEPPKKLDITLVNDTLKNKKSLEDLTTECKNYCKSEQYMIQYDRVTKYINCICND